MRLSTVLFSGGMLALATAQAAAQVQEGDVAAGRRLAREHCSACHAVEPGPGTGPMGFAAIARMPSTTSMSLRAFLLTPHPRMPNYKHTPAEIDDIVAYILSLRRSENLKQ